jgi:predicted amidohydrolase
MKVTILQTDIEWGNPHANIRQAEQLMAQTPDSDLYVLPEMWATGFATDPRGIAEPEAASATLQWMRQTASDRHCAICGSLAIETDGTYRNRHYFVDGRSATEACYDKHHLFSYGHEDRYYTPGYSHTVVDYMGFRLLLLTCYDLRFPLWSRYADSLQFDAIVCVANWPESRQNAFQILSRARAIENQAFLVACNRVGNDEYCHYRGQSAVVSPIGKTLAACPPNRPAALSACLDHERLDHIRQKFQVLQERDIW